MAESTWSILTHAGCMSSFFLPVLRVTLTTLPVCFLLRLVRAPDPSSTWLCYPTVLLELYLPPSPKQELGKWRGPLHSWEHQTAAAVRCVLAMSGCKAGIANTGDSMALYLETITSRMLLSTWRWHHFMMGKAVTASSKQSLYACPNMRITWLLWFALEQFSTAKNYLTGLIKYYLQKCKIFRTVS